MYYLRRLRISAILNKWLWQGQRNKIEYSRSKLRNSKTFRFASGLHTHAEGAAFSFGRYHEDLHAIVEKSKDQQQKLLAALEQKQKREAEEILSSEAVKSSEKLNEVRSSCACTAVCVCVGMTHNFG